jgi:mannose-6-phosphate isomerase-like protein (cupin superfamily)
LYGFLEVRDVKRKYALEEAKKTGRPPEIEVFAYNTKAEFEQASVGIVEARGRHGRIRQHISDRVYLVLEGEGEFFFGDGERDEVVPVGKDDVVVVPKDTAYDYGGGCGSFSYIRPPTSRTPTFT